MMEAKGKAMDKKKDGMIKHFSKVLNPVSSKLLTMNLTMRSLRELAEREAQLVQRAVKGSEDDLVDPNFILELTKSIHGSGEKSISDYILRNKEILLNEHSSVVRRQVIQDMRQKIIDMNEKALKDAEKLECDVKNFMELIQSSEKLATETFEKVCKVAKENDDMFEKVEQTEEELFELKTEVEKSEEVLIEYLMCSAFLQSLAPAQKHKSKKTYAFPEGFLDCFSKASDSSDVKGHKLTPEDVLENMLQSKEDYGVIDVPFKSPDQVINILDSLKDRNLALIQNSRLSKGITRDEMSSINEAKSKMCEEMENLDDQIKKIENDIVVAEENYDKLNTLVIKLAEEDLDKEETARRKKQMERIIDIYRLCTGSDAKSIDLTLMRATIDSYVENLMINMNKHPKKTIKRIMKRLEAERKLTERKANEALRAERQSERMKKAAASSSPKKFKKP